MEDETGRSGSVTFTVSVVDIPDETPVITSPNNTEIFTFNENDKVAGSLAISINGTDGDAGESMTFTLISPYSNIFELNTVSTANTGAQAVLGLTSGSNLDYDGGRNTYEMVVL